MSRLRCSFFWSSADRYGSLGIQFLSIAALSRLLTPQEFGVCSIIAAVTALANTFRELGGANYLKAYAVASGAINILAGERAKTAPSHRLWSPLEPEG